MKPKAFLFHLSVMHDACSAALIAIASIQVVMCWPLVFFPLSITYAHMPRDKLCVLRTGKNICIFLLNGLDINVFQLSTDKKTFKTFQSMPFDYRIVNSLFRCLFISFSFFN